MSTTLNIYLGSFEIIKKFESAIANMKGKFSLCSGHYVVEAKSVMGILSMDMSKPIRTPKMIRIKAGKGVDR